MFRWCSMLFIVIVPAIHVRFGQRRVSTRCQRAWACKSLQNMFAPWQHELKNPCDRKTAHDCLANLSNSLCWTSKHLLITSAHPCTQTRSWNVSLLDHQADFLQQRKHVDPVSSVSAYPLAFFPGFWKVRFLCVIARPAIEREISTRWIHVVRGR